MRSSFGRSPLNATPSSDSRGGARRHPRPTIDVPRAGRRAPARLSTTVDKTGLTHTNRSPINPVHFTVSGEFVVALKKRTLGEVAYLATVHGFPNNISVCEELIKPYNEDSSMSTLAGEYFCEELR
jgi:hypothetical protein